MEKAGNIWVLPEIKSGEEEVSKLNVGLLCEGRSIAEKVGGTVTALLFGEKYHDFREILGKYGASRLLYFRDPQLEYYSAEAYAAVMLEGIQKYNPWLVLMGNTVVGGELAPRLAALLNAGLVTNCVRIDFANPRRPVFYRPAYGGQLYQEIVLDTDRLMLVTMNPEVLNIRAAASPAMVETILIEPKLTPENLKTKHEEYLPADFQKMDVTEARTVVAAGGGAAADDILPMVEELAVLLEGTIGASRPVVDEGKIPRERLIGQTGKIVSPDLYLALGISGASHHVGGIQESRKIVSINRDPQAPIFRNSDIGLSADLKDVLPLLIERIKRAKQNGEII